MRRFALGAVLLLSCGDAAPQESVPEPFGQRFEVVADWPVLPPGLVLGRVYAAAIDSNGKVFVAHGANGEAQNATPITQDTILVFDGKTGAFERSFGAGLFRLPHGLTFDSQDHLWVTDSDAGRIFELDPSGRVLSSFGAQ
jgi:DNA-binding beta-propeller fold protein YncE